MFTIINQEKKSRTNFKKDFLEPFIFKETFNGNYTLEFINIPIDFQQIPYLEYDLETKLKATLLTLIENPHILEDQNNLIIIKENFQRLEQIT